MEIKTLTSTEIRKKEKIKAEYAQIVSSRITVKPYEAPYFEIMYFDVADGQWHVGFGSFCLKYVEEWLESEFEPAYKRLDSAITDLISCAETAEAEKQKLCEEADHLKDLLKEAEARAELEKRLRGCRE